MSSSLPLEDIVAFAVSRYGSPFGVPTVVSVSEFAYLPKRAALAVRTRSVVSGAQCLLAFPAASGLGKGTSLAINTALELVLPVWVAGPECPIGMKWTPCTLFGVLGWLYNPSQSCLFNI